MIYAPDQGFVFIHIGRTGGTSVERTLCQGLGIDFETTKKDPQGRWWKHIWAREMMRKIGVDDWESYFTFAFTRNPYDMILSLYSMYTQYPEYIDPEKHPRLYHPWNQFENFEHFILSMGARRHAPDEDWAVPLKKLNAKTTMDVWDSLQNLQTSYLTDSRSGRKTPGRVLVSYIGRYESLEDDFRHVCQRAGIGPFELVQHGATGHAHYRDLYSPRMRAIVDDHFWLDIRRFGYDF
jgi:hypothetical protein